MLNISCLSGAGILARGIAFSVPTVPFPYVIILPSSALFTVNSTSVSFNVSLTPIYSTRGGIKRLISTDYSDFVYAASHVDLRVICRKEQDFVAITAGVNRSATMSMETVCLPSIIWATVMESIGIL
jgi:hypothetical protein